MAAMEVSGIGGKLQSSGQGEEAGSSRELSETVGSVKFHCAVTLVGGRRKTGKGARGGGTCTGETT